MLNEYCLDDIDLDLRESVEGEIVKVLEISFLGDVDKSSGVILSADSGCKGCSISEKVLVVERFRGSTVGTYVLYSLCKKRLAPKAILCLEPDPVVVAGAVLCRIPMVYNLPKQLVQIMKTGDKVRIEKRGETICLIIRKESW